jgi:uncharacterized DUF497 family protein
MGYLWDPAKRAANIRKHGIDFADAVAVTEDPLGLVLDDDRHDELRMVTIGLDSLDRLLVVVTIDTHQVLFGSSLHDGRRLPSAVSITGGTTHE